VRPGAGATPRGGGWLPPGRSMGCGPPPEDIFGQMKNWPR
jgi:hypothetical protein